MDKVTINRLLVQNLPQFNTGRKCKVKYWRVVKAIIYKLKSGVQWRNLPIVQLFGRIKYTWQSVYYHFRKWCKHELFKNILYKNLDNFRSKLDTSIDNLDGSHTPVKRGGQAVGYQGRKKTKTTNMLFLTDKKGIPLACSDPVSGNHNDLFEIKKTVSIMLTDIKSIKLDTDGMFVNADAGFDSMELKELLESEEMIHNIDINKRNTKKDIYESFVFDKQLYRNRFVVEQANAWLDGFKTFLVRFETNAQNWHQLHYLAATIIFLRRIDKFTISF